MADLGMRTALSQIEVALQSTILLALGAKRTTATPATLRSTWASSVLAHNMLAYVTSSALVFVFDRYSTTAHNGTTVVAPSDDPTAGRWLVTTSTASTGYLKQVKLYEGEPNEDSLMTWLFGAVPSVVIVWEEEDYQVKSTVPGALYRYVPNFSIWCVSRNLRPDKQGVLGAYASGPSITSEQTTDPGANRIVGDLRYVLAGSTLGQTGVDWCEIVGASRVMSSATAERGHVYRLRVRVYATLHNAEETAAVDLDRIDTTYQHANLTGGDGAEWPTTYVTATDYLAVTRISTLTGSIAGGTLYIDEAAVTAAAVASHSFSANVDAYRFLSAAGAWTFVEVAAGQAAPDNPTGTTLIGVTSTTSDIAIDRIVAPWLVSSGITDQIDVT